jgi:ParB-like chromosome segregation protein Spo0J
MRRLLDDVRASGGQPYFLQPIVVDAQNDGKWELIDGQ